MSESELRKVLPHEDMHKKDYKEYILIEHNSTELTSERSLYPKQITLTEDEIQELISALKIVDWGWDGSPLTDGQLDTLIAKLQGLIDG